MTFKTAFPLILILILMIMLPLCLLPSATDAGVDVDKTLREIKNLEENGKYGEVMSRLSRALRDINAQPNPPGQAGNKNNKARILIALGDFYRDVCGDMRKAKSTYKRAIKTAEPGSTPLRHNPLRQATKQKIEAILALETTYKSQNRELKTLTQSANRKLKKEILNQNIQRLKGFTAGPKDYYLLHEVYYALALHYQRLDQPGKVYDCLERAMALKPGIVFYLPVKHRAKQAYDAWLSHTVSLTVRILLIVLTAVALLLFYLSRPLKWLKPRYILLLVLLLVGWTLFFHAAHAVTGVVYDRSVAVDYKPDPGKDIEFRSAAPGSPGSDIMSPLFYYGLIAMGVLFVFTLGMRPLVQAGRMKTVIAAGCIYGFLLFSAFSLLFYMRHGLDAGQFKEPGSGVFYYISGRLHFDTEEPEPYVLTDPRAYPGLNPANIEDPYLRKWVEEHMPAEGKKRKSEIKKER